MNKKICVITGATSGIGMQAAKSLAREGFFVVLACRSLEKAEKVCSDIKAQSETQGSCCLCLDLSSFRSIESFADEFMSRFGRLDVLINNAGTICDRHHETEQGFEMTMGVNYPRALPSYGAASPGDKKDAEFPHNKRVVHRGHKKQNGRRYT